LRALISHLADGQDSTRIGARGVPCPVYPLAGCVEDLDVRPNTLTYAVADDAEVLELLLELHSKAKVI
jgi:hypothetical protein